MNILFFGRGITALAGAAAGQAARPVRRGFVVWLILALRLSLLAATPDAAAPFSTSLSGSVSIPAEITGHVMFVNVLVNGCGPFRVMVDTGCSFTLVSPELAEAAGAPGPDQPEDSLVARNGMGDPTEVQRVMLETVELGAVRFEGVPAAISDSFAELSAITGRRIDGALGFPLFQDLFLGLDFPNRRLLLGSQWPADAPAILASLPVTEHADVPFVQVQIQDKPVEVMIDTGSNHALQLPGEIGSTLQWKVEPRVGSLVAVIGEIGREEIGRLAGSLSFGDIRQVEPAAVISSGPASLGLRSLDRFCVIFHHAENRVWLCGPDPAPILPTAQRSIGLALYSDRGGLRIAGVIPGSPAEEAHVSAGSLVTQIEGKNATGWTHDDVEQWIEAHASVALVIADHAGEHPLTLRVWDLVPLNPAPGA